MPRKPTTTYEPGDEPTRCCAKAHGSGERCRNTVVSGRRVCRFHGGHAGRPIEHGRYSQGLGRFRAAYQEALNDPALLDLRETLALIDLAVQRAAERAAAKDVPEFRQRALDLFEEARASTDTQESARLLGQLGRLLQDGITDDRALDHLAQAAERLAKRQEKAWKLRLDAAQAINARDLVAVLAQFTDIILSEAPKDVATRIVRRIDGELLGSGPTAARLAAGDTG